MSEYSDLVKAAKRRSKWRDIELTRGTGEVVYLEPPVDKQDASRRRTVKERIEHHPGIIPTDD